MKRNFLFMMSGSIACAKATGLVSDWTKRGHSVRVVCTSSARRFVGPATLEGLSGNPVFTDPFEPGQVMDHIHLAQWADAVVVCPATSNLINKFATGLADDGVTTLWQAAWGRGIPLFVVPAMNTHMWRYPATQAAVERLRQWGVHVLPTAAGDLACGEQGAGRMLETDAIDRRIQAVLDYRPASARLRVLVTGGGTREPIDSVRFIGNHSTGRTAAGLARTLAEDGHEVTWLGAAYVTPPDGMAKSVEFSSFADLEAALQGLLAECAFDLVIHAAAVSDFSVVADELPGTGKIDSGETLQLTLAPNPKLLSRIRGWSCNPGVRVIGFKLTSGADADRARNAVERQFRQSAPDWVVHNDMQKILANQHHFSLYTSDDEPMEFDNSESLARGISQLMG